MTLRPDQTGWLLATGAVTLAPHLEHLPPQIAALAALLIGWRAFLAVGGRTLPSRFILIGLAAAIIAALTVGKLFPR